MNKNKKSNKKFVSYDYDGLFKNGLNDIAHWVCFVVNNNVFDVKSITLKDSQRSIDEGNKSIQVKAPLDAKFLTQEIKNREIDLISFDGTFKTVPISVSVNIHNYKLSIALNRNHSVDINEIEKEVTESISMTLEELNAMFENVTPG